MKKLVRIFLIVLLVFIAGCSDGILTEAEYIEKAKLAMDSGNYRESIIHLKNALSNYPESAESRFLLGGIYARAGEGGGAEKELKKAVELGVSMEAVNLILGDALLMQGKADQVIRLYKLSSKDSELESAQKNLMMAEAFLQKGELERAMLLFDEIERPNSVVNRAWLGKAAIYLAEGKPQKSEKIILMLIADDYVGVRTWLTQADVNKMQGDAEAAIVSYQNALNASHNAQDYFYRIASYGLLEQYLNLRQISKAEALLDIVKKEQFNGQFPDVLELNYIRALLAFYAKDYLGSKVLAEKVFNVNARHIGAVFLLGANHALLKQYEQSETFLKRFLRMVPSYEVASKMLALVQLALNEPQNAVNTLKPIVSKKDAKAEMLSLIAEAAFQAGDALSTVAYYKRAVKEGSDSLALKIGLAKGLSKLGEHDQALEQLASVNADDSKRVELAIVKTHLSAQNYSKALSQLDKMLRESPGKPILLSMKGEVYFQQGDWGQASIFFSEALSHEVSYLPAIRGLAATQVRLGEFEQSQKTFEAGLTVYPNHSPLVIEYTRLLIAQKKKSEAENVLLKFLNSHQGDVPVTVLLAQLYLKERKPSSAVSVLRALEGGGGAVLAELGNAQMMLGEAANAVATFKALVQVNKKELPYYLLYKAALANSDVIQARVALDESININKNFLPSLIASVSLAIKEGRLDFAQESLNKLVKVVPPSESLLILKAELALYKKQPKMAINIYESLKLFRFDESVMRRLGQAYWMLGDKVAATQVLEAGIEKWPSSEGLWFVLASTYSQQGWNEKAIAAYEQVVQLNSKHVAALNNLAWAVKNSDLKLARQYAQKAIELAPNNSHVKDTLVGIDELIQMRAK